MRKLSDKNRLSIVCPKLCKEWNWEKNGLLRPDSVSFGSHVRVWWKCENGHEWQTKINDRKSYRTGCPYCSGHRANKDNCLSFLNPKLCEEWDYENNIGIYPENFTTGSNKIVWWVCSKGHKWMAQINNRNDGRGCPYCSHNSLCKENSLAIVNPKLAKEWHPTKNGKLTPHDVSANSNRKVYWKCQKGHEHISRIASRNVDKSGCPYCSGHRVCKDNCLATLNAKLASEWHPTKNGELTPNNVTLCSGKHVWWMDRSGHEWKSRITNRSNLGNGCPICGKILLKDGISFDSIPEAYFYLKHLKSKYKTIRINRNYGMGRHRYDFYIPRINTYIEVTGYSEKSKGWAEKIWKKYCKTIMKKRAYVENVLKGNFKFIIFWRKETHEARLCERL